jgi:hypothetical protein
VVATPVHARHAGSTAAVHAAAEVDQALRAVDARGEQVRGDDVDGQDVWPATDTGVVDHRVHPSEAVHLVGNAACLLEVGQVPHQPVNSARFAFLDPRAQSFYLDWKGVAKDMVAVLQAEAGRDPSDPELTNLVGELSTQSETFRKLWATHNVRLQDTGVKAVRHLLVGEVTFTYESMELVAHPGLTMFLYTPKPGSKSEEALNLLASWTAAPDEDTTHAAHQPPRDRSGAQ